MTLGAENPNVATDDRSYTVTGLENGVTYRVTLVNTENIMVDDDGVVTFLAGAEGASLTGFAAVTGDQAAANIVSVNGSTPSGTKSSVASPVNGQFTFTIEGLATGSVTPVFYKDGGTGGTATTGGTSTRLEITATAAGQFGVSAEQFGIAGSVTYVPAEPAQFSAVNAGIVRNADAAANTFTLDNDGGSAAADVLLRYVAGDRFTYASNGINTPLTEAQFEQFLSTGDTVSLTGSYNPGANTFNITTDAPAAPTNLAGTLTNADAGAAANDVALTWTAPGNPNVNSYRVEVATVTNGAIGAYNPAVDADLNAANTAASVRNLATGTFAFRVVALTNTATTSPASNVVQVTVPASADTDAPSVETVNVIDNQAAAVDGTAGKGFTSSGDQITVTFSEAVTLTADAQIHFRDADGTVFAVQRGVNSTFTPAANNETVFITLTGAPILLVPGATELTALTFGLNPLVAVNSVGVADAATNQLAEVNVASSGVTNTQFVLTFNSPINPATLTAADFTIVGTDVAIGTITANDANTVFTVLVTNPDANVYTATLRAQTVTGVSGGNGPSTATVVSND